MQPPDRQQPLADDEEPHYGVSTGFGALATRHIAPELRAQLQRSLVRSHAAGVGKPLPTDVVRAMLLLLGVTLGPVIGFLWWWADDWLARLVLPRLP